MACDVVTPCGYQLGSWLNTHHLGFSRSHAVLNICDSCFAASGLLRHSLWHWMPNLIISDYSFNSRKMQVALAKHPGRCSAYCGTAHITRQCRQGSLAHPKGDKHCSFLQLSCNARHYTNTAQQARTKSSCGDMLRMTQGQKKTT